jgi:hypothetical protein
MNTSVVSGAEQQVLILKKTVHCEQFQGFLKQETSVALQPSSGWDSRFKQGYLV